MGFVFEKVPETDIEFLRAMKLKDCLGTKLLCVTKYTKWCADRERNAYLIGIGGGYREMPYFYVLWWNGHVIKMEINKGGKGNVNIGVDIIWFVNRIYVPKEIWENKDALLKMIEEAFYVNLDWCEPNEVKCVQVKFECEAEMVEIIKNGNQ